MIENSTLWFTLLPAGGYLAGSIPFAWLLARAHGVDIRKFGSGNVGATNLGRAVGRNWGVLCFLLDMLKGLLPMLAARWLIGIGPATPSQLQQAAWLAVGGGCIFGHVFSVWLRFRGGKGVATSLGVVLGVWPFFTLPGLAAFGVWVLVTGIWRYVSLGSVAACLSFLLWMWLLNLGRVAELWPLFAFAAVIIALIVLKHRSNLARLAAGTEHKIGSSNAAKKNNTNDTKTED